MKFEKKALCIAGCKLAASQMRSSSCTAAHLLHTAAVLALHHHVVPNSAAQAHNRLKCDQKIVSISSSGPVGHLSSVSRHAKMAARSSSGSAEHAAVPAGLPSASARRATLPWCWIIFRRTFGAGNSRIVSLYRLYFQSYLV